MNLPLLPSFQFLIIDDDPGIANFLATYLRQKGHTCEFLTDGFETAAWLAHKGLDWAADLLRPGQAIEPDLPTPTVEAVQ